MQVGNAGLQAKGAVFDSDTEKLKRANEVKFFYRGRFFSQEEKIKLPRWGCLEMCWMLGVVFGFVGKIKFDIIFSDFLFKFFKVPNMLFHARTWSIENTASNATFKMSISPSKIETPRNFFTRLLSEKLLFTHNFFIFSLIFQELSGHLRWLTETRGHLTALCEELATRNVAKMVETDVLRRKVCE